MGMEEHRRTNEQQAKLDNMDLNQDERVGLDPDKADEMTELYITRVDELEDRLTGLQDAAGEAGMQLDYDVMTAVADYLGRVDHRNFVEAAEGFSELLDAQFEEVESLEWQTAVPDSFHALSAVLGYQPDEMVDYYKVYMQRPEGARVAIDDINISLQDLDGAMARLEFASEVDPNPQRETILSEAFASLIQGNQEAFDEFMHRLDLEAQFHEAQTATKQNGELAGEIQTMQERTVKLQGQLQVLRDELADLQKDNPGMAGRAWNFIKGLQRERWQKPGGNDRAITAKLDAIANVEFQTYRIGLDLHGRQESFKRNEAVIMGFQYRAGVESGQVPQDALDRMLVEMSRKLGENMPEDLRDQENEAYKRLLESDSVTDFDVAFYADEGAVVLAAEQYAEAQEEVGDPDHWELEKALYDDLDVSALRIATEQIHEKFGPVRRLLADARDSGMTPDMLAELKDAVGEFQESFDGFDVRGLLANAEDSSSIIAAELGVDASQLDQTWEDFARLEEVVESGAVGDFCESVLDDSLTVDGFDQWMAESGDQLSAMIDSGVLGVSEVGIPISQAEAQVQLYKALEGDPAISSLRDYSSEIFKVFGPMAQLIQAAKGAEGGVATLDTVVELKSMGRELAKVYDEAYLRTLISDAGASLDALDELNLSGLGDFGIAMDGVRDSLMTIETLVNDGSIPALCESVQTMKPDDFNNWCATTGVVLVCAIGVGILCATGVGMAIAGTALAGGLSFASASAFAWGAGGLLLTSAAMGFGAVVGQEIGKEVSNAAFDTGMESEIRLAAEGEKGWGEVSLGLAKQWGVNTAISFALLGAGQAFCAAGSADIVLLSRFSRSVQQVAGAFKPLALLDEAGAAGRFVQQFLSEIGEELAEDVANGISPALGGAVMFWNSLDGQNVAAGLDGSSGVSFLGQETHGNGSRGNYEYKQDMQDGLIASLEAQHGTEGAVEVDANGVITCTIESTVNGKAFTNTLSFAPTSESPAMRRTLRRGGEFLGATKRYGVNFDQASRGYSYDSLTARTGEGFLAVLEQDGYVVTGMNADGEFEARKGTEVVKFKPSGDLKAGDVEVIKSAMEAEAEARARAEAESKGFVAERRGDVRERVAELRQDIEEELGALDESSPDYPEQFLEVFRNRFEANREVNRDNPRALVAEYGAIHAVMAKNYPKMLKKVKSDFGAARVDVAESTVAAIENGTIKAADVKSILERAGQPVEVGVDAEAKNLATLEAWLETRNEQVQQQKEMLRGMVDPKIEEMTMLHSMYGVYERGQIKLDAISRQMSVLKARGSETLASDPALQEAMKLHASEMLSHLSMQEGMRVLSLDNRVLVQSLINDVVKEAGDAGLTVEQTRLLVEDSVEKLFFQTMETTRRQLGDHGIRHILGNIRVAKKLMAELQFKQGSEYNFTPEHTLLMMMTHISHDMGYTAAIGASGVDGTGLHPLVSDMLLDSDSQSELFREVLGEENFEQMKRFIRDHDGTEIFYDPNSPMDTMASIIRLSDNMALFGNEKLPEVFATNPKALKLLGLLQTAQQEGLAGGKDNPVVMGLKAELKALLDQGVIEGELSLAEADLLKDAVDNIFFKSGEFTLGMVGGRYGGNLFEVDFDKDGRAVIGINLEESTTRELLEGSFDSQYSFETTQFLKMVNDYLEGQGAEPLTASRFKTALEVNEGTLRIVGANGVMEVRVSQVYSAAQSIDMLRTRLSQRNAEIKRLRAQLENNPTDQDLIVDYEQALHHRSFLTEEIAVREMHEARQAFDAEYSQRFAFGIGNWAGILGIKQGDFESMPTHMRNGLNARLSIYLSRADVPSNDPRYEAAEAMMDARTFEQFKAARERLFAAEPEFRQLQQVILDLAN